MKILMVGFDAPWINTGFASTLRSIGYELVKRGHEVFTISGNFVFDTDGPILYNGLIVLSNKGADLYPDKNMFLRHYNDVKPDVVIAHNDFYRISYFADLGTEILDKSIVWLPIENTDRLVELPALRKIKNIAFTTQYGADLYKNLLIRSRVFQINHQVGSEFCETPGLTARMALKYPKLNNKFVLIRVDRNQPRKKWELTLGSFAAFIKKYYIEDAILIAKTRPRDVVGKVDLEALAKDLGIEKNVIFIEDDLTTQEMWSLYNLSNVFISTTGSEGFGLSIAEAMVAGKPILCPEAQPLISVVGDGAGQFLKVKCKEHDPNMYVNYNIIDEQDASEKIYKYYQDWKNGGLLLKQHSKRAILNSRKYNAELVVDSFENAFEEMKRKQRTLLVAIATKNRADHLVALVTSIYNQTYRDFDIYIIDNSDDERVIANGAFMKQLQLLNNSGRTANIWKNTEQQNAPDTHQKILEAAIEKGYEYVLKIDDDCILENDSLEKMMRTISSDDNIGLVTCSILSPDTPKEYLILPDGYPKQTLESMWAGTNRQWFFGTDLLEEEIEHVYSSFIYRTKALEKIGGFPQGLSKVAFREETLTSYPMFLKGWRLINNQNAVMWHMKADHGGCRDHNIEELYKSDDEEFKQRLLRMKEGNDG